MREFIIGITFLYYYVKNILFGNKKWGTFNMKPSNKINWRGYDRDVLIFMFRYCLSRKSYAVGTAIELIKLNWDVLSDFDKKFIQKEIKEHFDLYSPAEKYDMDRKAWKAVLELPIENKGEIKC